MSKYIVLTKILLKNNINLSSDKKKKAKTIALWILIAAAFVPTIGIIVNSISTGYNLLSSINQEGLILALGISFVSIFVFFFGIFYSLNVLYFTKDIENLLPLPLKPSEILGAKFTVALLYEYLTELVLFLPILIVYGVKSSASFIYYAYGIIIFLILPLAPLGIVSVLNMIIMSFTNLGKHKDKLKIMGGIGAMFIAICINILMQKFGVSSNNPDQMIKMITSGNNSLVQLSNKLFPGSSIGAKALVFSSTTQGFLNLLLYIILTLIVVLVLLVLGEKLYFKGIIGISETSSKRKELSSEQLSKFSERQSPLIALTMRELKILFRTPVYFMNCIIMNFLWPVFILLPMVTQPQLFKELEKVTAIIRDPSISAIIVGMALAVGVFLGASNLITATAISREGQNIFISKYIPVDYTTQFAAKILSGMIMGVVSIIVMLLMAIVLIKAPLYLVVMSLIMSIPGLLFSSMAGLLIDLNYPKLNWDNEVKAVKQNFNGFLSLIVGVLGAAISAIPIIKFSEKAFYITTIMFILFLIIDFILYKIIITKGVSLFKDIEI
jgi:ABC-2 type transport system permease protein